MPYVEGETIKGWGVVRSEPWRFAGVFETKEEAQAKADDLGPEYIVQYGENQAGTDNFVWSGPENPDA